MRLTLYLIWAVLCSAATASAAHTQVRLILSAESIRPGGSVIAGVHMRMDPHWHTYWKNAGASGIPTTVTWTLPEGVTAGAIQWPVPKKLPPDDLVTYAYEDEVVLLVPLTVSADARPGTHELKAKVAWLECMEACIPGNAEVAAALVIGDQSNRSANADLIEAWQKKLPLSGEALNARAWWEKAAQGNARPLIIEWTTSATERPDFYPEASNQFEVEGATERVSSEAGTVRVRKMVKKFQGDWPREISGLLMEESGSARIGHAVTMSVAASAKGMAGTRATLPGTGGAGTSLWQMLLYAFIGGLILNVMPCVLPVIALKVLGFVSEARSDPGHVRRLGLVYGVGVIFSFLVLAALVIGVKAAGHQAGWGMQFGNPQFLVVLTVLVTLVALSLFGLFEINLGGRVMGAAGSAASRQGPAGAFFNGVLATALATPCTAPFLGVALGFAFLQPPAVILLMFATVGLGLASPYIVLSWNPAWLRFLPKPGLWMERFKVAMGFPMLATAVWLFSLTPAHYGRQSWWLAMFLVIMALAAWVYGEFVQRSRVRRGIGVAVSLVLLVAGYVYVIENQLNWRTAVETVAEGPSSKGGIQWQAWSPDAVAQARVAGHPVLVDFTADWCLTCQANKKLAIEIPSVREKLKATGAVPFIGDYTRLPPRITEELQRYGRAGVPLVLVYPPDPEAPPIILPEVLTPGIVLNALDRATL